MFLFNSLLIKNHWFALSISLVLFIIPFFWLKPGEMDLGGDANRLYFYDPISFIRATALYDVAKEGKGLIDPRYFYLPYVALIAVIKYFVFLPTFVIDFFNGLKLAVGFFSIYLIFCEILENSEKKHNKSLVHKAGILSGVFYTVSFSSLPMAFFWDRALFTHDQVFLNPLLFLLLLKFFTSSRYLYLWIALLVTFIFSTNFSLLGSAPPLFAFYPLVIIFLLVYIYMLKKEIPWKKIVLGFFIFLGIHAFHLLAEIVSFIDTGSSANSLVFSKQNIAAEGVGYFSAIHQHGQGLMSWLLPSENHFLMWTSLISPLILILGFLSVKRTKIFFILSLFFILTFFLVTANITDIGFELYKRLFYLPGFAMFRNFYTQWMYVFIFFYSLLLGYCIYGLSVRLKKKYIFYFFWILFFLYCLSGLPLLSGALVNRAVIRASNNVKTTIEIDPAYEQTLTYIKNLPNDGKIMILPLTESFRQVISDKNGGAYEGPSTLLDLTDKYSFVGYQHFGYKNNSPYAEEMMKYAREKEYKKLQSIFTTLNIRYILHNTDPNVYEKGFSPGSYGYMLTAFPKTQKEYIEFLQHFPLHVIYKNGPYIVYEVNSSFYNSTVFIPEGIYESKILSFDQSKVHSIFIDPKICKDIKNVCKSYMKPSVNSYMKMSNPTLYMLTITKEKEIKNLFIVLQHTFHSAWKIYYEGKELAKNSHIVVNEYANGWLLQGKDIPKDKTFTLSIQLDQQKYFFYGWYISLFFLVITIWGLLISLIRIKNDK